MKTQNNKVIQDYEKALARVILCGVEELPIPFGIKKVIRFLKGTKSSFVIDHGLHKLDMYGVLPDFKADYLVAVINKLLEKEFLTVVMVSDYENLPTIKVTPKGKSFLEGKDNSNVEFVYELSNREIILLDREEQILFDSLKKLRKNISEEIKVPEYMICNNVHLREMAKMKPRRNEDLLSIRGIGEAFIEKYGDKFLSITREFLE